MDLLLLCCSFKDGARIQNWFLVAEPLNNVLVAQGPVSKQKCLLVATVVAKADTHSSRIITKKVFEIFRQNGEQYIGLVCQMVGELNESYFQKWVLEEFVQ
jgi:hypothetical protein